MTNVEISKKIARLVDIMVYQGLTIKDRYQLIDECEIANTLEDLSPKYKTMILQAEKYYIKQLSGK